MKKCDESLPLIKITLPERFLPGVPSALPTRSSVDLEKPIVSATVPAVEMLNVTPEPATLPDISQEPTLFTSPRYSSKTSKYLLPAGIFGVVSVALIFSASSLKTEAVEITKKPEIQSEMKAIASTDYMPTPTLIVEEKDEITEIIPDISEIVPTKIIPEEENKNVEVAPVMASIAPAPVVFKNEPIKEKVMPVIKLPETRPPVSIKRNVAKTTPALPVRSVKKEPPVPKIRPTYSPRRAEPAPQVERASAVTKKAEKSTEPKVLKNAPHRPVRLSF
jgi:hypothetical protein